ncbi:hypothetical protein CPC08DRAFT_756454 [Agrocybe pediades]|nr:hypothetical protein CPC08DRAFT_756454 [Agrocybe pediades]
MGELDALEKKKYSSDYTLSPLRPQSSAAAASNLWQIRFDEDDEEVRGGWTNQGEEENPRLETLGDDSLNRVQGNIVSKTVGTWSRGGTVGDKTFQGGCLLPGFFDLRDHPRYRARSSCTFPLGINWRYWQIPQGTFIITTMKTAMDTHTYWVKVCNGWMSSALAPPFVTSPEGSGMHTSSESSFHRSLHRRLGRHWRLPGAGSPTLHPPKRSRQLSVFQSFVWWKCSRMSGSEYGVHNDGPLSSDEGTSDRQTGITIPLAYVREHGEREEEKVDNLAFSSLE